MPKSSYEIMLDYRKAIQQAESLERIADDMHKLNTGTLSDTITGIQSGWEGENANAYLKKCNQLKEKIRNTEQKIRKNANAVRAIAKSTYDAELHALQIATVRKV